MTIPTNHGEQTPESIVTGLTYISYKAQRNYGMSAERARRLFANHQPGLMEQAYQMELDSEQLRDMPEMAGHEVGGNYRASKAPTTHASRRY